MKNNILQIWSTVWLTQDQPEKRKDRSWFINPFNYCDLGGSLASTLRLFAENKHVLSNTFWLWPPGLKFLTPYKCCQKRQLCKTKPYAMERRHLPRETSALHNVTSENKELFLMCLRLRITLSQLSWCAEIQLWWVYCHTVDIARHRCESLWYTFNWKHHLRNLKVILSCFHV